MIGKKINQLATELAPESTDLTIIGDPTTGVSKKITIAQLGAIFSGAVSFYNDLASFPATGDINVIYCAKDTKKLYLWTGSAYVEVFPSQALLDTYQLRSEKGNANGYASLDSQGKVPISQLPSSIMEYKGTWNASTNTPTLANGTGDTGDVYICNVAGTVNFGAGPITFAVGDYVIYSGTIWQRSSGAVGTVTSVAASITGDSVTISGSPVTTSGTLAFAFAGTGAQYIKGDGTLATFPTTIEQAKNLITEVYNSTGATLTKGTVVYINGGQGNLPTVTKALASGDSTSAQTYGIVQADITNNNNGFVVVAGRLADIDTQAFSVGTQLYLSSTTAGAYTSTKQYAPAHLVYIGIIVRSHPTQGIIEVKIQNGYELDELHNVAAQTPTNNDGLFWESATSLWKNKSIATVLGYTPANAATYVPYTGATANVDLGAFDLISRSAYLEGTASYQAGLLIKQRGLYNFVTGAYTQIVADSATDLNIVHNQANTTRRRYALSVAALQDGDTFQYLLPRANGTFALTSDLTGGTVTSVAALTIGTSGTDLSSTVANSTTTPVITLNVPTASATNRGALSSADWTTFNNKQNALTNPVTGTGTTNYLPKFTGTSAIGDSVIYDNSGNIGIGTTAANTLLSLVGNHAGGQSILKIQSSTAYASSGLSSIGFNDSDGSRKAIIYANTRGLELETSTTTPIIFNTNGNERLRITASGNVSIGNTNDTYKLDVSGTSYFRGLLSVNTGSVGTLCNISDGIAQTFRVTTTSTGFDISNPNEGYISFSNSTERLRITSGGIVQVNTTASIGGGVMNLNGDLRFGGSAGASYSIINYQGGSLNLGTNNATNLTIASTGAATFSSSVTATGFNTPERTSAIYGINTATTNGNGGNLTVKAGGGYGSGNTSGNLYLATGRGSSSASSGDIIFGRAYSTDITGVDATYMTIKDGGNVGIGTTSPGEKLTVNGTIGLQNSGTQNWGIYTTSTNNIVFQRSGIADRMVITSDGNVGIGTSSPTYLLDLQAARTASLTLLRLGTNNASTGNGDKVNIDFFSYGDNYINARISREIEAYATYAGALTFATGSSGSISERMRITSGGQISQTTSIADWSHVISNASTTSPNGMIIQYTGANKNNTGNQFLYCTDNSGATLRFEVRSNGGISNYQANDTNLSDIRTKKDITPLGSYWDKFKAIEMVKFKYKDQTHDDFNIGVIAQQVEKVAPEFVDVDGWGDTPKDGVPLKSIYTADLHHATIKVLQEAMAKIEDQQNQINELKSQLNK